MFVGEENSIVESVCRETWNMVCCKVNGLLSADWETKWHDTAQPSAGSPFSPSLEEFYNY